MGPAPDMMLDDAAFLLTTDYILHTTYYLLPTTYHLLLTTSTY